MAAYGTLTALLVDRTRRRRGHPAALRAAAVVAVAADAAEGRRARVAALVKFAVLAAALGYAAVFTTNRRAEHFGMLRSLGPAQRRWR